MQTQEEQNAADAAFAARALDLLADEPVPAALETRILNDFDRLAAAPSLAARLAQAIRRASETIWPGAPLWQPACVLALSLILGLAAGMLVPSSALVHDNSDVMQTASLDAPPQLDLSGGEL